MGNRITGNHWEHYSPKERAGYVVQIAEAHVTLKAFHQFKKLFCDDVYMHELAGHLKGKSIYRLHDRSKFWILKTEAAYLKFCLSDKGTGNLDDAQFCLVQCSYNIDYVLREGESFFDCDSEPNLFPPRVG